ncbi:MAG: hypothetical protein RR895_07485 [Hydrogenoanaerobacterium sp.]
MISLTKFLKIKKDDDNEFYDVNLKNSNMDIIDAAAEKDSAAIAALQNTKADSRGYIASGNIFDIANSFNCATAFGITDAVTGTPMSAYCSANLWLSASKADGTLIIKSISHKSIYLSTKQNGNWGAWEEVCVPKYGTWTPVLLCVEGTNPSYTIGNITSGFEVIGKFIHIWARCHGINIINAGTGWATIGGIPRISSGYAANAVEHYNLLARSGGTALDQTTTATIAIIPGSDQIKVENESVSMAVKWKPTTNGQIHFDLSYRI